MKSRDGVIITHLVLVFWLDAIDEEVVITPVWELARPLNIIVEAPKILSRVESICFRPTGSIPFALSGSTFASRLAALKPERPGFFQLVGT